MPWIECVGRGARAPEKNTKKPFLFLLLKHSSWQAGVPAPGPGEVGVPEMLGLRNTSWAGRQPCWLHGRLLALPSPFSLPRPALLGILADFTLGQEHWNARVRTRQWVVHELPPEMSDSCPGRADKGSGEHMCVLGWVGAVLVGQ